MKCAIILVAVYLAAVLTIASGERHNAETPEQTKIKEECAKEHNIDLSKFKHNPEDKSKKPEITHDYKCFTECFAKKLGFIGADGNTNYEKVKEGFPKLNSTIIDIIKTKCTSAATDACDKYFEKQTCAMKIFRENL